MSATSTRPAAGSVQVDASAKTDASVQPKAPEAQPKAPETPKTPSPDAEVSEFKPMEPWQLIPRGEVGVNFSANGQRDGSLFDSSFGGTGDFVNKHLALGLLTNANGDKVQFRFGGMLNWDWQTGNDLTFGSTFHHGTLGPVGELNFREAWRGVTGQTFAPLAYLGLGAGLGVGHGTGTLNDGLLHTQTGLASYFNAYLNLVSLSIGDLEMGLNLDYRNTHINGPGDATNWPVANGFGASVHFGPSFRQEKEVTPIQLPPPPPEEVCQNLTDQIEVERARIYGTGPDDSLMTKIEVLEVKVKAKRQTVETRPVDPLQDTSAVREFLREAKASEIANGKDSKLANSDDPKDKDAKEKLMAESMAAAKQDIPDGFDFWAVSPEMPSKADITIPDPLPEDCDELSLLLKRLSKAREDLEARYTDLKRVDETPLHTRERVVREIIEKDPVVIQQIYPKLPNVNFVTAQPRTFNVNQIIAAVKATPNGPDGKPNWNSHPISGLLSSVFGSGKPKALQDIMTAAEGLNQSYGKHVKNIEVAGHTDSVGTDTNNQSLSQRRADLIMAMLVRAGVDSSRLTAKGYGETDPEIDEKGLTGQALIAAQGANRRIELVTDGGQAVDEVVKEKIKNQKATTPEPAPAPRPAPKATPPSKPKPKPGKVPPTDFD